MARSTTRPTRRRAAPDPSPPPAPEPSSPPVPLGRPLITATDDQLLGIRAAAQSGCTEPMICNIVFASIGGIDVRTFRRMKHRDPRILSALRLGVGPLQKRISQVLIRKAESGDVAAIKWLEMTRWGVREVVELTTSEDQPLEVVHLTPGQKVDRLKALIAVGAARTRRSVA